MKRTQKKQSFGMISFQISFLVILALLFILLFLVWGMQENRKLANQYVQDTAKLYVEQVNKNITQIDRELIVLLGKSKDIAALPDQMSPQEEEYYHTIRMIMEQNRVLKIRYDEVDHFYVYARKADVLISDVGTSFSQSAKSELNENLMQLLAEERQGDSFTTRWLLLHTAQEDYIISRYTKGDKTIGCIIHVDDIFRKLEEDTENYHAIAFIELNDGRILMSNDSKKQYSEDLLLKNDHNGQLYQYRLNGLGQISLYVLHEGGILENVLTMQIVLVVLVFVLLVICVIIAYSYYQRLLEPIKRFTAGLDDLSDEWLRDESGKSSLIELEAANDKFKELLQKIQTLKIAVYEEELMKQKALLEYTQEQIKPHFFLNCLSLIHVIADEANENQILKITEILSDYMRYIFKDSGGMRTVAEELKHVRLYVEIQKLRYGENSFSYGEILEEEVNQCVVPSLLFQTLIENTIVHGFTVNQPIEISLYVTYECYEDEKYLYICVSDTGTGFSKEILEAIEQNTPIIYNGRKHIGLQNICQRLALTYGKSATMKLSNMDEGFGAVVEIHIPVKD